MTASTTAHRLHHALRGGLLVAAVLALSAHPRPAAALTAPAGFVVENAVPGANFDTPVSIAFLPDGRMLVGEKRGRVWMVQNGVVGTHPLWAAENEVLNVSDRGLLSIAVDPHYYQNHYVYLLYTVDPDSNGVDADSAAYGRLTRYQVGFTDSSIVDPASRTILMGTSWADGPPSGSPSHTIGTLRWGADGTLLVSVGDGASFTQMDPGGLHPDLFLPGRTPHDQDVGAFRAQYLGSLGGKILRLDPTTGHGLPSNPFWDGNPTSVRSRVWEYGFRNPFRFAIRPGTGSSNPTLGKPGSLYVGDVGWNTWEELDIAPGPGLNFGWPCYEGIQGQPAYQAASPAHSGCDSTNTFNNPATARPPDLTWNHQWPDLGTPPGILGNASIGGTFYTGTLYPAAYQGRYFFADFGLSWIKVLTVDAADHWSTVDDFMSDVQGPVDLETHPITGDVYYVSIYTNEIRRIRYSAGSQPVAVASATPMRGSVPLLVDFSSTGTHDPDNDPLALGWSFGDGTGSTEANPEHMYTSPGVYPVFLTADDGQGGVAHDTLVVTVTDSLLVFPTTGVLDRFDRADGSLGGAWTGNIAGLAVSDSSMTETTGDAWAVWNGGSFGPNQEAFVTFRSVGTAAPETDLMLKTQGASWQNGYVEVRYDATLAQVKVSTYTPGVGWQAMGNPIPALFRDGDQFGARADSIGDVHVFVNGALAGDVSIAGWPYVAMGGRLGIIMTDTSPNRYDDFGGGDVVYTTNVRPHATILAPPDGMFYAVGDTIRLVGQGDDPDQSAASLDYRWQIDIHHNNHVHPSSYVFTTPSTYFIGENHDDGTGVHLATYLIVTDAGGLRDTAEVNLWPEIDVSPANLVIGPGTVNTAATTPFAFTLRDLGRMPASRSHWQIVLDDGTTLAQGDTLVAARDSLTITGMLAAAPSAGVHTLRVVADTLGALHEVDETNNTDVTTIMVASGATTGVASATHPLALSNAYPNPAHGEAAMTLDLPRAAPVAFEVLDVAGRVVWSTTENRTAGRWTLRWPGTLHHGAPASPGLYLARVRTDGATFTRRIALIR